MADVFYKGLAVAVAQVDKFTPTTPDTGDVFTLTATGLDGSTASVSFTVAATQTVAAVTAGLVAAWNASTNALMTPVTAADVTTHLTLTADVVGVRFVVAGSATGGETLTRENTTANISAKDWNRPENWSVTAVAQVDDFTPSAPDVGDIYTLTVTADDGSTLAIPGTGYTSVAEVIDGLLALWNASTDARCTGITASNNANTTLKLTADTAGVAFSVASSADGGETFTRVATTANVGAPGAAASDDVYIEDAEILYGLDQSAIANTLASLNVLRTSLGSNPAAGRAVIYFQVKATVITLGLNTGMGSGTEDAPINIDTGATASTIYVYNTGTNSTSLAVRLKANCATTDIVFKAGVLGLAYELGEVSTIRALTVEGGTLYAGIGLTVATITAKGGTSIVRSGLTTLTQSAGTVKTYGSGAITTVNLFGGLFESNSTGTIGALNITGGAADFTKSRAARTVTTPKLDPSGSLQFDIDVLTLTNKLQPILTTGKITYTAT
jgi:hypothetical protein